MLSTRYYLLTDEEVKIMNKINAGLKEMKAFAYRKHIFNNPTEFRTWVSHWEPRIKEYRSIKLQQHKGEGLM